MRPISDIAVAHFHPRSRPTSFVNDESPKVRVRVGYKTDQTRLIVRSAVASYWIDNCRGGGGDERRIFQAKCENVLHLVLVQATQRRKWAA